MSEQEFEQALPIVRSKVLERIRNHTAEDIFQEVSFRASQKLDQFEDETQLFAYCWSATAQELRRNMARDGEHRQVNRDVGRMGERREVAGDTTEIDFDRACWDLTEEQKQAVREILLEGASTWDVGLPRQSAYRLSKRIRERMQEAS